MDGNTSRRGFLLGATAAGAGALSATALRGAPAFAAAHAPTFNVRNYGATGDGVTSDSTAIQSAINAAQANGGGIVQFPAGTYLLTAGLVVSSQVTLQGVGWVAPPTGQTGARTGQLGAWLYLSSAQGGTGFSALTFNRAARGSSIRDIAFFYVDQPTSGGSALNFPASIHVQCDDVLIEDVFLYNPTFGINIDRVGRAKVNRVSGQPLKTGIAIVSAHDVVRVTDIHFWPFFSDGYSTTYSYANGTAVTLSDVDNPFFSNIFALGYKYGFYFGPTQTNKFHLTNIDLDSCDRAVSVHGTNTTGQIVNLATQGKDPGGTVGIECFGSGCTLQLANIRVTLVNTNGIRLDGTNNRTAIDQLWIDGWNLNGTGFPGVECVSGTGSSAFLSRAYWIEGGGTGPQYSAGVTIV